MSTVDGNEYYRKHTWLEGVKRWKRQPLPQGLTIDGTHVWEPPIFNYTDFIDETYEKKREAVLKYTGNDRARTTHILDLDLEADLINTYRYWIDYNIKDTRGRVREDDELQTRFLAGLHEELDIDGEAVWQEWKALEVVQKRRADGTFRFMGVNEWYEEGWSDEEPLVIPPISDSEEEEEEEEDDDDANTETDTSSRLLSSQTISNAWTS